ncbi:MAG: hypothetical protein R3191_01345 [Anaerolineales bacterium]|nr:hypothetical protein [Anaerolineales bacterium]
MKVRLFGSLSVEVDGQPVDLSTRAEQLLLAQISLGSDQPCGPTMSVDRAPPSGLTG